MAVYDALALRLVDQDKPVHLRVREGDTVDEALNRFLKRLDEFESDWVALGHERFVRYDQVIAIEVLRRHDSAAIPRSFSV